MKAGWKRVPLGEVLVERKERIGTLDADELPLLGVSNQHGLHRSGMPRIGDMSRYLRVEKEWFAYNPMRINVGSLGWAASDAVTGVISPDYVVFSCSERVLPQWVHAFLRHPLRLDAINAATAGSVRERLYFHKLATIEIPLPPLAEQRRLVARIDALAAQIDEARWLRREAEGEVAALQSKASSDLLDRVSARYPSRRLLDLVDTKGGGTPSKANSLYWNGTIPWVSPKDMKRRILHDAIDHISEAATKETASKLITPGAVVVVVRGMILAHTFPSAVLGVRAAINQDMKALVSKGEILPEYLCSVLWAWNSRMLELVEKSTHDTRKLQTERLLSANIPVPPLPDQHRIVAELDALQAEVDVLKRLQAETAAELDALLPAILDRAFQSRF